MNPFDELELDPRLSPKELTEALKIRAERASADEKQRIQTLWRTLTLKESDRVRWALFAHPRPRSASADAIEKLRGTVPPAFVREEKVQLTAELMDVVLPPKKERDPPPDLW